MQEFPPIISASQQIEWTVHKRAVLFENPINILEALRINELSYGECHLPFFCSIDTYSHHDEVLLGVFIC